MAVLPDGPGVQDAEDAEGFLDSSIPYLNATRYYDRMLIPLLRLVVDT